MEDLIEAFQIFSKYSNEKYPTWCEHDVLHVIVDSNIVDNKDINRLAELGFIKDEEGAFISFRFGSC